MVASLLFRHALKGPPVQSVFGNPTRSTPAIVAHFRLLVSGISPTSSPKTCNLGPITNVGSLALERAKRKVLLDLD